MPIASGRPPSIAAMVVMRIGLNLSRHAWKMASSGRFPSRLWTSSAKSIIRIAFFFTIPMSRMIPMSEMTDSSMRQTISARSAPTPADGSVERIVTGWMRLS